MRFDVFVAVNLQRQLINAVSGSLIRAPDFKEADDPFRLDLIAAADIVAGCDAEFILKVHVNFKSTLHDVTVAV